jgi:hypothetical protein
MALLGYVHTPVAAEGEEGRKGCCAAPSLSADAAQRLHTGHTACTLQRVCIDSASAAAQPRQAPFVYVLLQAVPGTAIGDTSVQCPYSTQYTLQTCLHVCRRYRSFLIAPASADRRPLMNCSNLALSLRRTTTTRQQESDSPQPSAGLLTGPRLRLEPT